MLHLAPRKNPETSKTNKSRGRDRSKDQQRGKNNRSKSGERGGERDRSRDSSRDRDQFPREKTGRVVEEGDKERELVKLLKQKVDELQKKNSAGANMNSVRKVLFEDDRREEENYREDERNWLRNE